MGAKGLRQFPKKGEKSFIFGADVGGGLRDVAKIRDMVDDERMGPHDRVQSNLMVEPVRGPVVGPFVLARRDRAGNIFVKCEGITPVLRDS